MQVNERVALVEVDGLLRARVRATTELAPVDGDALHLLLERSPYADWALRPDALTTLCRRLNVETDEFEFALGQREDGRIAVEVAPDASSAWLELKAARGGKPVRADDALQALAAAGVTFGIDTAAVQQGCAGGVDVRIQAARAVPPTPGENTCFELLVVDTRDRAPKVDEHGLIDFHELGDIPMVKLGQPLMRRHPPTPGIEGHDVRGVVLAAKAGMDEGLDTRLGGSVVDPKDPDLLRARCSGQPVRSRNGVAVEELLRLKNVSLASGNIHYDGTVEVAGDVSPGMTVQASGDIVIHGLVEGARIDARGSVKVGGGIIARAVVNAGVAVSARFAENASIQAGTAIVIEQMALHCDLQALNQVLIGGAAGSRGRLVGGSTRAMMLVRTSLLGAPAGGITKVQVGVNPVLAARRHELERQSAKHKEEEDKLLKVLTHLRQHGDPRGMLPRVQAAWKQSLDQWGGLLAECAELDRELAQTGNARIEVEFGVSGDVDIAFGNTLRHLRRGYNAGVFRADAAGHIIFGDSFGHAAAVS